MKNKRLHRLFKPKSKAEISTTINAIATYYSNTVTVFVPSIPFEKLPEDYETKGKEAKPKIGKANEEDVERSLRRSKKAVRGYALCNEFDMFVTFTFNRKKFESDDGRFDLNKCKAKLKNWIKNEQKRKGKFEYLVVAEQHKNGAWHFHSLIKGYKGQINKVMVGNHAKFNLPSFQAGFTDVVYLIYDQFSQEKIAYYITKYITKDMPRIFGKNRYWASSGLNKPIELYNPSKWYKEIKPLHRYKNDWGEILTYLRSHVPKAES